MNAQSIEIETVDNTHWDVPAGLVAGIAYTVGAGFIAGSIALDASNITLVPIVVAIMGFALVVTAWLMRTHDARDTKSRATANTWAFGWLVTVVVGLILSLSQMEAFYNLSYRAIVNDGSITHIAGGIVGVLAFTIWTAMVFARPGGGYLKWIGGSLLYLLAQAMPIGFALTIGWLDAGHFF